MRHDTLRHVFIDTLPDQLEEGVLYISIRFATAAHKCCCGCGHEVNTKLSPIDWALTFDGKTVSLTPSIGNWSFPCQSHYFITRNRVEWARRWTKKEIEAGRANDRNNRAAAADAAVSPAPRKPFWQKLKKRF